MPLLYSVFSPSITFYEKTKEPDVYPLPFFAATSFCQMMTSTLFGKAEYPAWLGADYVASNATRRNVAGSFGSF